MIKKLTMASFMGDDCKNLSRNIDTSKHKASGNRDVDSIRINVLIDVLPYYQLQDR